MLDSTRNMATHVNKCSVTVLASNIWRWPSVAETCCEILRNINELHCDGVVYNIFRQVNATGCLNTEFWRELIKGYLLNM
jgi:hypothetical protein